MLQVSERKPKARSVATPITKTKAEPPIMTGTTGGHPIFGAAIRIEGFALEQQLMTMLNYWHKKAIAASDAYWASEPKNKPDDDPEYDVIYKAKWDIFEATFKARVASSHDLACLLQIVMRHVQDSGDTEFFTAERLQHLTDVATAVAKPPEPQKRVGDLRRGRKLTRAGLLLRYHAFLIGELQTVSWNLYGSRNYAQHMIPIDHEVTKRTSELFHNGKPLPYRRRRQSYPFFDESKLTHRARAVLKSLKINTEKAER
jgi:hypothetical protein